MISRLSISRFKSIRALQMDCRKVNVLIGAPDTGKTNVLDALQLLSRLGWGAPLDGSLRISPPQGFEALFHRQFFDQPFEIRADDLRLLAMIKGPQRLLNLDLGIGRAASVSFGQSWNAPELMHIRHYSYADVPHWGYDTGLPLSTEVVTPPHGANLMYIARHVERVYDLLKELVGELNWKLRFDNTHQRFVLSEVRKDDIIDYNLELLSDSIKRFFFFGAILRTSSQAVLVFDEPDVQAFPPYPKQLGRMIAEDETNQFFLTTHNPYFLSELAEKTDKDKLGIFVCRRDPEGGTEMRMLTDAQVQSVIDWGASVFFNLDQIEG